MESNNGNLANESCGWASRLPVFQAATIDEVLAALAAFVRDAPPEQFRAWKASMPLLQDQCARVQVEQPIARSYGAVVEYQMPDSMKRADAILLVSGAVLVLELKGDGNTDPGYIEQVADYARKLYWYHSLCGEEKVHVHTIVVAYGQAGIDAAHRWHTLTNIARLHEVVRRLDRPEMAAPIPVERFIEPQLNQPALSLVKAARQFFANHALPRIKRIDDVTGAAVQRVVNEIRDTHARQRRKLILLSGVPGAGKTFVGLQIAHSSFLDDLAERLPSGEKPTAPAVFLSGNGPLVEVLQYELKQSGGDGRVFVRGVKEFVQRYSKKQSGPPPHHVLIFDEAQRAWDAAKVRTKHPDSSAGSEPEAFVRFAERVPGWCVVMGLIGDGQQIHSGEEGGMQLWAEAVRKSQMDWEVVGPERFRNVFSEREMSYQSSDDLHLSKSVRFHFAAGLSDWAAGVVEGRTSPVGLHALAEVVANEGYQLRVTRDLRVAKEFLWKKYAHTPDARFGLLVSSRDKGLAACGIEPRASRFFRTGPWYADPESSPNSCRRLQDTLTEFAAQGLELDHTLLLWGTDFIRKNGQWDISAAKIYRKNTVKDAEQLRRNAYRVLLTRGREGVLICLPQALPELDETYEFLMMAGCEVLE